MGNLFYQISQVLGITLLHSLWQGLIVYLLLRFVLQLVPRLPARFKYGVAYTALCIMLGWFGYTLFTEIGQYNWLAIKQTADYLPSKAIFTGTFTYLPAPAERYYFMIAGYLPYISALYIVGLIFNALRMSMALNSIYHIRRKASLTGFSEQIGNLSRRLGIAKHVQSGFSELIDVPCITGFLKPIILLPVSISTSLSAEEITTILLHELAHVRRNDYLFNLLQQAINMLLFFNPFAQLINRIINREREHCCDDMVVKTTDSPLVYAHALLKLEENSRPEWQLALAATGNKHYLFNRIERIMKTQKTPVNIRPALIALMVLICSLSSIAWLNPKAEHGKISIKAVENPLNNFSYPDTVKRSVVKVNAKPALVKKTTLKKDAASYTRDSVLERLQAQVVQHAKAISDYYNSAEFAQMQADITRQHDTAEQKNAQLRQRLQAHIDRKQADLDQLNDDSRLKQLKQQLEEVSKKVKDYMTGPEYAKMLQKVDKINSQMDKDMDKEDNDSRDNKHIAEIAKIMQDFTNNSKIKPSVEQSKKLDEEIKAYYNQPEYLKAKRDLKAYTDSLKLYAGRQERPEQPEQVALPEYRDQKIMREKEAMKQAEKALTDYKNQLNQQKK